MLDMQIVSHSPLRRVDPRVKVFMGTAIAVAAFPLKGPGLLFAFLGGLALVVASGLTGPLASVGRKFWFPLALLFLITFLGAGGGGGGGGGDEDLLPETPQAGATASDAARPGSGHGTGQGRGGGRGDGSGGGWRRRAAQERAAAPVAGNRWAHAWTSFVQSVPRRCQRGSETIARVLLATIGFFLLTLTTTPQEMATALTSCGVPYRGAFTSVLALQHLPLVAGQLRQIRESQALRGIHPPRGTRRIRLGDWVRYSVPLAVPAIAMATCRAWEMTEAASARGLDDPCRRSRTVLRLGMADAVLFTACALWTVAAYVLWTAVIIILV